MSANNDNSPPTYRDLVRTVFRHKKKAILFFLAVSLASLATALFWPKTYRSQAMLFVRVGRESVTLDPTATTGGTVQLQASRESEINSVLDMLHCRAMSEKVVDRLGVETVLSVPPENVWYDQAQRSLRQLKVQFRDFAKSKIRGPATAAAEDLASDEHEMAVKLLEKSVSVQAPKNSSVITLTCTAQTPQAAQQIAKDWVDSYFDEHILAYRTSGSLKLFEHQTELVEQELAEAKRKITELKNRGELVSIEGQLQMLEKQKQEIEDQQLVIARGRCAASASLATLEKAMKEVDRFVLMDREEGHSNEASDRMREQLYREEIAERALKAMYSENHVLVKQKRQQIAELRKVFEDASAMRTHSKSSSNPNWLRLQLDMLAAKVKLADLEITDEKLSEQRAAVVVKIQDANLYALNIETLQRQALVLEGNYRNYANYLDQARVSDAIEQQRISNVNVVQQASFEPEPVSPRSLVVIPCGLFIAVWGAIALALICEYADPRLHSASDVQKASGLPVLIALPKSRVAPVTAARS